MLLKFYCKQKNKNVSVAFIYFANLNLPFKLFTNKNILFT